MIHEDDSSFVCFYALNGSRAGTSYHGVAVDVDLLGSRFVSDPSAPDALTVQHAPLLQLFGHLVIDVS